MPKRQSAFWARPEWPEGLGEANRHQYRQGSDPIMEAEATDQAGARIQDVENGLCDDQRF
jgi:hypothetical protein